MSMLTTAWQGVVGYYGRNLLTVLGLSLGLLTLVTVTSASGAVQSVIEQNALLTNGPKYTYTVAFDATTSPADAIRAKELVDRNLGGGTQTSVIWPNSPYSLVASSGQAIPDLNLVDGDLLDVKPFPILSGDWLLSTDLLAPVVTVNSAAASLIDIYSFGRWFIIAPTGQTVTAVVAGVVDDGQTQPAAYMLLEEIDRPGFGADGNTGITLLVSGRDVDAATIRTLFGDYQELNAGFSAGTITRTDRIDELQTERSSTERVFLVVIALALLGAVVAILNVGLAAVRERALELSLRRALGATRARILIVMLLETQIVAIVAWLMAIGASFALYPTVAGLFGVPPGIDLPPYPTEVAVLGLLAGSLASFVGGVVPAVRAASTNLSTVMRA